MKSQVCIVRETYSQEEDTQIEEKKPDETEEQKCLFRKRNSNLRKGILEKHDEKRFIPY